MNNGNRDLLRPFPVQARSSLSVQSQGHLAYRDLANKDGLPDDGGDPPPPSSPLPPIVGVVASDMTIS